MTTEPPQQPSIAEKIAQGLEEFADALESGEDVTQRFNCHKVVLELVPTPYTPELVRETRRELNASQAVFARFLGVSVNTVRSGEQGRNAPSDMARRFMDEIRGNPEYWRQRLREVIRPKAIASF